MTTYRMKITVKIDHTAALLVSTHSNILIKPVWDLYIIDNNKGIRK